MEQCSTSQMGRVKFREAALLCMALLRKQGRADSPSKLSGSKVIFLPFYS